MSHKKKKKKNKKKKKKKDSQRTQLGTVTLFFQLPQHLHLDAAALEKQFYALSRKLHPDRFASKPAAEQEAALAASSQLNDAYRTLKDPILRTQYLLKARGCGVGGAIEGR